MMNRHDDALRVLKRKPRRSGSTSPGQNSGLPEVGAPQAARHRIAGRLLKLVKHPTLQLAFLLIFVIFLLFLPGQLLGKDKESGVSQIIEGQADGVQVAGWIKHTLTMTFRLSLAALLAAILAFRPRKALPIFHRNPYVTQTHILLAVVAAALMMIVADNAARAFGIFAAASLVRFRTNIRDPKEITVLLINLGIGLATGVGRWELAIGLSLFVFLLLQLLEHHEASQVLRAMELRVKTYDVDTTDQALRGMFARNHLKVEVRMLNLEDQKHPLGKIVYRLDVNPAFSTDQWAEEILSSDPANIDSIEWHQKKTASYVYR
jgi:uncharacterized membrane protein YhiD involved in acid resistance